MAAPDLVKLSGLMDDAKLAWCMDRALVLRCRVT